MTIPSNISASFDFALRTINPQSILAQIDNPVHGDELRKIFFDATGVTVTHDWDNMLATVYNWAKSSPDYDENIGRSRKVQPL